MHVRVLISESELHICPCCAGPEGAAPAARGLPERGGVQGAPERLQLRQVREAEAQDGPGRGRHAGLRHPGPPEEVQEPLRLKPEIHSLASLGRGGRASATDEEDVPVQQRFIWSGKRRCSAFSERKLAVPCKSWSFSERVGALVELGPPPKISPICTGLAGCARRQPPCFRHCVAA